jgi:hypothetical protein
VIEKEAISLEAVSAIAQAGNTSCIYLPKFMLGLSK